MRIWPPSSRNLSARWMIPLLFLQMTSRLLAEALPNPKNWLIALDIIKTTCWGMLVVYLVFRLVCEYSPMWGWLGNIPDLSMEGDYRWCLINVPELGSARLNSEVYQRLPQRSLLLSYVAESWSAVVGMSIQSCRTRFTRSTSNFRANFHEENESFVAVPQQEAMDRCDDKYDDASGLELTVSVHDKDA